MIFAAAHAETFTWTGLTNDDWTDTSNWKDENGTQPSEYPNDSDSDFIIPSGCPEYPVIDDSLTIAVQSISIDDGASLTINGTLEIYNDYEISSNIDSSSSGSLLISGKLSNTADTALPNLTIECDTLAVTKNLTCKELQIDNQTTLTSSVELNAELFAFRGTVEAQTLSINSAGAVNFIDTVEADSLTINSSGAVSFSREVDVDVLSITATDKTVTFSNSLTSSNSVSVTSENLTITSANVNDISIKSNANINGTVTATGTFNAATDMGGKSITLKNSIVTADKILLSGAAGSLLTIAGTGTSHSFSTSDLTATYLSIDSNIALENYSDNIENCEPTAGTSDENFLAVIRNGWAIKPLKEFTFTWSGTTDSAWNKGSNWNTGIVPVSDCKIIIPSTTNKPVLPTTETLGGTLSIQEGASISLSSANLVLSGKENTTTASTILSNAGTIVYNGNGRIINASNPINDTTQGTVEYAGDGTGSITNFGNGDDYYNLKIGGNKKWSFTGSTIKIANALTINTNAVCNVTESTTLQANSFAFDGSFYVSNNKNVTLTPYSDSDNFTVPLKAATFDFAGTTRGWVYLGSDSFTGDIIFDTEINSTTNYIPYKLYFNSAVTLNKNIRITNSVTATKNLSGTGSLIFAGTGNIVFAAGNNQHQKVQSLNNGTLEITGNCTIEDLTINGRQTTISDSCTITNLSITNADVTFSDDNTITTFTATSTTGNTLSFGAGSTQTVTNLSLKASTSDKLLNLTSTGSWNIECPNEPTLEFLSVHNSTASGSNFTAFKSTDANGNSNWDFPDMIYKWVGTSSTDWNTSENWETQAVPTKGAKIEITATSTNKYPKLTEDLDLNTTSEGVVHKGEIVIDEEASFDLAAQKITLGKITNKGLLQLNGISAQISCDSMLNEVDSTVEYTGTGTDITLIWDGDSSAAGKQYENLILNKTSALITENLTVFGNLTINKAASIDSDITISVDKNVTATANLGGNGKLIFTGTNNQIFETGGKTFTNLEKKGNKTLTITNIPTIDSFTNASGTGAITFKNGATINSALDFQTAQNVTLTGTLTAESLLINNQFVADGTANVNTTTTQTYNGNVTINNGSTLNIQNATAVLFAANKTVSGNELKITKADNTIFNGTVNITKFTDAAAAGAIHFNAGGFISATDGQVFNTTSEVAFGDDSSDSFIIGSSTGAKKNLTHETGETKIKGKITAADITFATTEITGTVSGANITLDETSGGPITLIGSNITLNEDFNSSGTVVITNSGLLKTIDGKDLTFAGSFKQNGSGDVMLGGSFTGSGSAEFSKNVYLYGGNAAATVGASGAPTTPYNIDITGNLIIARSEELTINADNVYANNIVLYSGSVDLNGDIFSTQDMIIVGSDYSAEDPSTGFENEYAYNAPRPRYWATGSFKNSADTIHSLDSITLPDNSEVSTKNASLTIAASGKKIHVGKNFYANGATLSGTAEWYIDIPSNADSSSCFAEAYECSIENCTVRLNENGEKNDEKAQIVAENCTLTSCTNFDNEEFLITEAYTTRDNVVCVIFNRAARNLNDELNDSVSNFKYFSSADNDTSYSGIAINEDGSGVLSNETEPEKIYLKAATDKTWNTDATGTSAGDTKSTDSNGKHKTAIPYIDIPRALGSETTLTQNAVITDRFGKRLKNYSTQTPEGKAYGTDVGAVLDKTGPVLVQVRTGQETHETELSEQKAYDAHNFIEFIYSEPVNFGDQTSTYLPASSVPQENIQVTSDLGKVTSPLTDNKNLSFAGIGITIDKGKIHTRKQGSTDDSNAFMNAMYRDSTHSLKISIAGYAENVGSENISWPGYIESAETPFGEVHFTSTPNVTDCALNTQIMIKTELQVDSSEQDNTNYGTWDTQPPAFVRVHSKGKADEDIYQEAIGNGDGSTLNRIEIHIADNSSSETSQNVNGIWITRYGWAEDYNSSPKSNAADYLIGGSRPFANTNKTSGGLRYCTILNQHQAFKYSIDEDTLPSQNFIQITPGASAPFFTSSTSDRNEIPTTRDNTYISLELSDTGLLYKTTFIISYNTTNSYMTDLAGNPLRSSDETKEMKTIERTSPDFKLAFAPINNNKLLLIFVKQLSKQIKYKENGSTSANAEIPESFEEIIPYCFKIGTINSSSSFDANSGDAIQIDTSVPARIISQLSSNHYTAIELTLTKNVTLEDVKNLYIRLENAEAHGYDAKSQDPLTGIENSYVTFIQDSLGNYMQMYQAHALSDFAAGIINPLYAYNDDLEFNSENITKNLYENGSWAVHDWNEEQGNYGTLIAQKPVTLISAVDENYLSFQADGTPNFNLRLYYSTNPTIGSQSENINYDLKTNYRLWFPNMTDSEFDSTNGLFPAYSNQTNHNFSSIDSEAVDDSDLNNAIKYHFDTTAFSANSKISFLFGLLNDSNTQESICITPTLSFAGGTALTASYSTTDKVPLLCIRLKNPSDITSMDLWSFRTKSINAQRGGITILNNVINVTEGEKTVIKVNLAQEDKLNISIMTLDGNIITYLNRGNLKEGEHYFSWDGKNQKGRAVARGMYFVRITGSDIDETRKVMVVK